MLELSHNDLDAVGFEMHSSKSEIIISFNNLNVDSLIICCLILTILPTRKSSSVFWQVRHNFKEMIFDYIFKSNACSIGQIRSAPSVAHKPRSLIVFEMQTL